MSTKMKIKNLNRSRNNSCPLQHQVNNNKNINNSKLKIITNKLLPFQKFNNTSRSRKSSKMTIARFRANWLHLKREIYQR